MNPKNIFLVFFLIFSVWALSADIVEKPTKSSDYDLCMKVFDDKILCSVENIELYKQKVDENNYSVYTYEKKTIEEKVKEVFPEVHSVIENNDKIEVVVESSNKSVSVDSLNQYLLSEGYEVV